MEKEEEDEDKDKSELFYKLIYLVVDMGTEVLLKLFLKNIPQGQTVEQFLKIKATELNTLKKKKIFNDHQLGIINALPPDQSLFDISLLYILISNLSSIQAPNGGWYIACPMPSDQSAGAHLMNLRRVRNEAIAHRPKSTMKKSDFEKYWKEAKDILINLASEVSPAEKVYVNGEIDRIKTKQIVGDKCKKLETLLLWEKQDRNCDILYGIEELTKKTDQGQEYMKRMFLKIGDQGKTQKEMLKTLVQTKTIPGTSSGNESSVIETINTRTQKRKRSQPCAIEGESGAKRTKKSHDDKGNCVPDQKDGEYDTIKKKLRSEMIDHYTEYGCCSTAVPALRDGEEVHIDEVFVMPSMKVKKNIATGKKGRTRKRSSSELTEFTHEESEADTLDSITTIPELFKKNGDPIRRVCVSGDAGQGKTILCRKIVSAWCKVHSNNEIEPDNEHQFLKSFDFLFYLRLRNNRLSNVIEMIKTEIVRKASHNALEEVLEEESEKCLIILDGLDEWLPSEDCKHKLPYIDPREKFTVLITSRPWKLEVLRPKTSEIGQEIELKGIEKDKLTETVVNILNSKCGKIINWFNIKFEKFYAEFIHLAPIISTQMICMWYDREIFGNTTAEIYSKALDYLFRVAYNRHQETSDSAWMRPQQSKNKRLVNVLKELTFCDMYSDTLCKLSCLAYHTLFNDKMEDCLIFPHKVTEIHNLTDNDVKCCLSVGILSQKKSYSKASSDTKDISFIHKTFQEFLAALYIAIEEKDTPLTLMRQTLRSLDEVFEMSEVLIFLSALRPDLLGQICCHIAQLSDKDESIIQYRKTITKHAGFYRIERIQHIVYTCLQETENKMVETKVVLHDYIHYIHEYEETIPFLKLEEIKSFYPYDEFCQNNHEVLDQVGYSLVKICIYIGEQKDADAMACLIDRSFSSLISLHICIDIPQGIRVNINNFSKALLKVRNLNYLKLECGQLSHSNLEDLRIMISKCTQLKEIDIDFFVDTISEWERCNCDIDLSHNRQLQSVDISNVDGDIILNNGVPLKTFKMSWVKCIEALIARLKYSTSLQELLIKTDRLNITNSETGNTTTVQTDDIPLYHTNSVTGPTIREQNDDIPLDHTNSVTGPTTTVQEDDIRLHHINSATGSTTIVQNDDIPLHHTDSVTGPTTTAHPTPLYLSKLLTDVIPTLKNLRTLSLYEVDFKQDILRLSPEMTCLESVYITSTMTLKCVQGFIDSLPQTQFNVEMNMICICP